MNAATMRNDMDVLIPLEDLLRQARNLHPHWRDPERFFLARSDLIDGIRHLIAASGTAVPPARPAAPAPVPGPLPMPLPRIPPVSAAPLVLKLSPDRFERLLAQVTMPNPRRRTGYQSRFRRWLTAIDEAEHSIELTGNDVLWLRAQLINRRGGGFQHALHKTFAGTHVLFSNLPHRPWRKRTRRSRQRQDV
jgi:hypothetical protein